MIRTLSFFNAFRVSLLFFAIAASYGLIMRLAFSVDLPSWISFSNIRHAHSHVALLGWLCAAFLLCTISIWQLSWPRYRWLYIALQFSVLSMALAFPVTGYAGISIFFSTLHLALSYIMIWMVWHDTSDSQGLSLLYLRTALFFLFLASLGTWALPFLMISYKGTALYYGAIQWYLHFMFNGWLTFVLLSILLKYVEGLQIALNNKDGLKTYYLLTIATVITYALAVTWSTPVTFVFYLNGLGVLIQLAALFFLGKYLYPVTIKHFKTLQRLPRQLIFLSLLALAIKIIVQAAVVIPFIAKVSYTIKNFVVGFIHLLMLGCLTLFVLAFILQYLRGAISRLGAYTLIAGIFATEFLLFFQGLLLWMSQGFLDNYYNLMTFFSIILFVGVWWVTLSFKLPITTNGRSYSLLITENEKLRPSPS